MKDEAEMTGMELDPIASGMSSFGPFGLPSVLGVKSMYAKKFWVSDEINPMKIVDYVWNDAWILVLKDEGFRGFRCCSEAVHISMLQATAIGKLALRLKATKVTTKQR